MDVSAKGPLVRVEARVEHEIEKVAGSRFLATLIPAPSVDAVLASCEQLRAAHPHARHVCWAYVGSSEQDARFSDDGEPSKTAGFPMLRVLLGASVRWSGALVVRYFGGQKLGTGGLVRAYTGAVRETLRVAPLVPMVAMGPHQLTCPLSLEPRVRHRFAQLGIGVERAEYGSLEVTLHFECSDAQFQELHSTWSAQQDVRVGLANGSWR